MRMPGLMRRIRAALIPPEVIPAGATKYYVRVWVGGVGTPLLFRAFVIGATPSHAAAIGIMRADVPTNQTFMVCVESAP